MSAIRSIKTTIEGKTDGPHGYRFLLTLLALLLVSQPWLTNHSWSTVVFGLIYTIIFASALFVVSGQRRILVLGIALALPGIVISFMEQSPTGALVVSNTILRVAFVILMVTVFMRQILSHRIVSGETVAGAICVFLFLGMMWSLTYRLVEQLEPGSFRGLGIGGEITSNDYYYFSHVTLTTLGYGDIVPVTSRARMIATLQAIVGQLFLTVLIARLVGLHVAAQTMTMMNHQEQENG